MEKTLIVTESFNPEEFLGKGWTIWKGPIDGDGFSGEEDIDPRSLALTEIRLDDILFETCLREKERWISGEEKLRRLKAKQNIIRLGSNVFLALWLDRQRNREHSVLEYFYQSKGITRLDFFGLILRDSPPAGSRNVLFFYQGGWGLHWLGYHDWDADSLSAVCASSF